MKKTIATALLIVSSMSVQSKTMMREEKEFATMCLKSFTQSDSSMSLMDCDSVKNNKIEKLKLAQNGCAQGQVAIRVLKTQTLNPCFPPGVVQL
jgi:hypothetical protein